MKVVFFSESNLGFSNLKKMFSKYPNTLSKKLFIKTSNRLYTYKLQLIFFASLLMTLKLYKIHLQDLCALALCQQHFHKNALSSWTFHYGGIITMFLTSNQFFNKPFLDINYFPISMHILSSIIFFMKLPFKYSCFPKAVFCNSIYTLQVLSWQTCLRL